MTYQPTDASIRHLVSAMLAEDCDVTVEGAKAMPWGMAARFSLDGVAFDQGEIIRNGEILCVKVLEEEFRQNHFLRIDCGGEDPDADEDDEGARLPHCVMVGIHTMAETSDDDYQATYGGIILVLGEGGDRDQWLAAAAEEQDGSMRSCVKDVLGLLDGMLREVGGRPLAGIGKDRRFRSVMRRVAAA